MAAFIDDIHTNTIENPMTLGDWVKNFRLKKIQMKRKLRSNSEQLRVCAVLTKALKSAETELRHKQQERFNKWIEFQSKLQINSSDNNSNSSSTCGSQVRENYSVSQNLIIDNEELRRQQEVSDLWKYELSGLDQFMKNISSSCTA